jgi:hypothetical protein
LRLYFNGCSFTYGDELSTPELSAWPALMSKHLGLEFTNDAVCGGTNQRIMYKTIQEINNYDCFVIAWTWYDRFTEYNPVDNFEINFTASSLIDVSTHFSDDLKTNYKKFQNYHTMYYKHWYNELYQFKQWLQQIILLQSLFKEKNKKYIMLNTNNNELDKWCSSEDKFISSVQPLLGFFDYLSDDLLLKEHRQIQNLLSMIDYSNFLKFNEWCIGEYCDKFPCGLGGHILEDGHIAVAELLINFYNKRYV